MQTRTVAARRARGVIVAALGAVVAVSCRDLDVQNLNAPTAETLSGSPTRAVLGRAAIGVQTQITTDLAGEIQQWGIYGRELYNLLGNDPRETGEEVRGPQDPGGRAGGVWGGKYQAIRTVNTYLAALENGTGMSEQEKSASKGLAKTFKAWYLAKLAVRSGPTGIPIEVDQPISAPPAPLVSFADAMTAASTLMDEAQADLQAAGTTAFPFEFVPGFTGFNTPATFIRFNRALAAKILVWRATFNACTACWAQASTALNASFITTTGLPGSLATGVYYGYTGAAGEQNNPISEAITSNRYWAHPSIITGAQKRANGDVDLRVSTKLMLAPAPHPLNDLVGTYKPVLYNSAANRANPDLGADIPWITNEELILLRAEIRWNTNDKAGAIADLDLIRTNAGGLPPTTLTAGSSNDAFVTELLYNRLYSLMFTDGVRWIDARRYNRLATLPIDRPGDKVHPYMLIPSAECDARGLSVPCTI